MGGRVARYDGANVNDRLAGQARSEFVLGAAVFVTALTRSVSLLR